MSAYYRIQKSMLIAAAVFGLMTAITGNARAEARGDFHYLAVGVSKVPLMPARMQLRFAHKDALDLTQTWKSQGSKLYGNVRGETLIDENAKLADILAGLERLEANTKAGDTAVVSFAGHGGVVGKRATQWLFVPYDHNPLDFMQTCLQEWQLRDHLARMTQRGVTVILILDTCHSGAFAVADSSIVILAACTSHGMAGENSKLQNGLFSGALIEAVQGKGDANGDGQVTLAEVENYVARRVAELDNLHPAFNKNGQRIVQQPVYSGPSSVQRDRPLAAGGVAIPDVQSNPVADRIRIQSVGK